MERRRGIRSLIPTGTLTQSEEMIQEVPVDQLSRSPFQPRVQVGEEGMAELVASVKTHGILQPLVARRVEGELQLIAGERRLEAARKAGLERVPVVVREATDREMLELALVENLQREDINAMEAEMKDKGLTRVEYALLLSAQDALKAPEAELIPFIKGLMKKLEPQTFPGWNLKGDTFRQVQRTIFESLHEHYSKQVDDLKQLIELRDEFIKWIERHGSNR